MDNKYTIKQVAAMFDVSHDTVTRWVKSGKVKGKKESPFHGKTTPIFISAAEVERLKQLVKKAQGAK